MGKNLPAAGVQKVHCGASNVWPGIVVQQQCCKLKKHLEVCTLKLMKASKRRSAFGYICMTHHFTTKTLTLWSTAITVASADKSERRKVEKCMRKL
jgi:hypothetical protein